MLNILPVAILLNGVTLDFNFQNTYEKLPYIQQGVTLVPMRATAKKLGVTLSYDSSTKTTNLYYAGRVLTVEQRKGFPVFLHNSKSFSYIPLRFFSHLMKAGLSYDAKHATVSFTTTKELPSISQKTPEQRVRELLLQADEVTAELYVYQAYGTEGPTVEEVKAAETSIKLSDVQPILQNLELGKAGYRIFPQHPTVFFTFRQTGKKLGTLWVAYYGSDTGFSPEITGIAAAFWGNDDFGLPTYVLSEHTSQDLQHLIAKNATLASVLSYLPPDKFKPEKPDKPSF